MTKSSVFDSLNLTCYYDAAEQLIEIREDLEGWFSGKFYQYNAQGYPSEVVIDLGTNARFSYLCS